MEPVRVGVVGIGSMGLNHARIYSELPQTELVGVVDIQEARGRQCSARFNTTYFESYQGLFDKVDAVNIVVPTSLHYPVAMEFLKRGVHVLVEKPIAVDLVQAKRLVDYSKRHNLVLQVGHLERFNPAVMKLRDIMGQPIMMECSRRSCPTNRNLDVGVVWDLMIHDLDILIHLVNSPVQDISANGVSVYSDYEDIAQVQLRFQNGVMASLVARRMFSWSISRALASPTPTNSAWAQICSYTSSRRGAESFLLSSTQGKRGSGGMMTQAATTGPSSGPRPASSMPAKDAPKPGKPLSWATSS